MMKKVLCSSMAICLLLCFCSCDKAPTPAPDVVEDEVKKEEAAAFISVMLGDKYLEEWDEDNVIQNVSWNSLRLTDEDAAKYPDLKKTFDKINEESLSAAKASMYELSNAAEGLTGDEYNPLMLENKSEIFVQRADSMVVSCLEEVFVYRGGVHPDYGYAGLNIDSKTGKELALTEVLTNVEELPKILSEKLLKKYDYVAFGDNQPMSILMEYAPEDYQWTIDYQGMTFWFSPYDIAPYVVGALSVKLYFEDYKELFDERYVTAPSESYAVRLPLSQSVDFDLVPDDGKKDTLYVYKTPDEYGSYYMLSVTANDKTHVDEINYAYDFDVYVARVGNKSYLYADAVSDNDYHMFSAWEVSSGVPNQIKELYGTEIDYEYIEEGVEDGTVYKVAFNNPQSFCLETRFEILGTRGGVAAFKIDEATGIPQRLDDAYTFNYGHPVVTAMPLDAYLLPEKEKTLILAGEELTPYQTDGESFVDLKLENGGIIRLDIDLSQWPLRVNGIPEEECFEEILYAG